GGEKKNFAVPGGMAVTKDGKTLFVALAGRNSIGQIDIEKRTLEKEWPTQCIPFEVRLSDDESTLIVSNWGGRLPNPGEPTAKSDNTDILIDAKGAPASGTLSVIDRKTENVRHIETGIHPCALAVRDSTVYVACAMSDTIDVIDWKSGQRKLTIPLRWGN